ncbi:hypothetical protein J2X61_001980 [Bacillus sp. 3255]|nr:hypothetical protein [Bacillus sp. 3255]
MTNQEAGDPFLGGTDPYFHGTIDGIVSIRIVNLP